MPTLTFEHIRSFTGETGVHPWEENTNDITSFIKRHGCEILEIRGVDITSGLDEHSIFFLSRVIDIPEHSSTNVYPFNYFGNQTIIYGQKA